MSVAVSVRELRKDYVLKSETVRALRGVSFDVPAGETATDGSLTLKTARCLGSCGLAPVVVFDGDVLGHQSSESTLELVGAAVGGGA